VFPDKPNDDTNKITTGKISQFSTFLIPLAF
jgi:hypothetical protein